MLLAEYESGCFLLTNTLILPDPLFRFAPKLADLATRYACKLGCMGLHWRVTLGVYRDQALHQFSNYGVGGVELLEVLGGFELQHGFLQA